MDLGIYGAGGLATDVFDLANDCNIAHSRWSKIVFIDDTLPRGELFNEERIPYDEFKKLYSPGTAQIVLAISEPNDRAQVYERIKRDGFELASLVHPDCRVGIGASIGEGTVIRHGCQLGARARVGSNVHIQVNVQVGHDTIVGDSTHIASRSVICGCCTVGERCFIGTGSLIRERTLIGSGAITSMGAVVLNDVPENATVMGNPARETRRSGERVMRQRSNKL